MRCGIYLRVTNREELNTSLENQNKKCVSFLSKRNWDFYEVYADVERGMTAERVELQRLIKDAKDKKIDVILTTSLSRLARSEQLLSEIREIFSMYGVHLVTLDTSTDTTDGIDMIIGDYYLKCKMESATSHNERKNLS